jgi:N-carbamoyl-L-amino-acid hydrolase
MVYHIDSHRMHSDFVALAKIGATPDGGVDRPALSPAHLEARAWFRERALAAGLEFRVDSAGNCSAIFLCGTQGAPSLLLGSHLDSVPHGGRFDGALGVLAGLEVLRTVKDAGLRLPFNLEVIDFTDEEGTLVGLLGSRALAGLLTADELRAPRGGRENLIAGLERAGLTEAGLLSARRDPADLVGYLELHIEQGPRLLQAGAEIGVVDTIVGISSFRLDFIGRADHAGTTPLQARRDAGQGAAAFISSARQCVLDNFPDCVVNVGDLSFYPGAFNIVPERASLALEMRAAQSETLIQLETILLELANREADRFALNLESRFLGRHLPTRLSPQMGAAIAQAGGVLGLRTCTLNSGAGHDAQSLASVCPAGMLFVPSQDGASHSPREFTTWQDCVNGANVLLGAVLALAAV